ncbi:nucleotide sugar dehydrogenase [Halovenus marina]|uniref:nucleotide sugar dehydrogenase n=1 Tax=Halovenus marina TaxID=3396621 RepID=UPI003F558EBA
MTICVHGLGYVGLATASLFANNGHEVVGYDTDPAVLESLRTGDLTVTEDALERYVTDALASGLSPSDESVPAEYHAICVPTPYDDAANLTYVEQASETIAADLRPGDTIIVESTVPPTTTATTVAPLLEKSGLTAGSEFGLAYSPETILPGNTVAELRANDRIIGGIDRRSARTVCDLYRPVIDGAVHVTSDATTAEFVKLAQNAFRDLNIAYANELALLADDHDIDVREAIQFANTHPRVDILRPGPGVGGHCLPVDPLFLTEYSDRATLVESARSVNDSMPEYIAARLREELGTLADAEIAILGVAYKGNVAETRNSPGLALARTLEEAPVRIEPLTDGGRGTVSVRLSDPHVTDSYLDLYSQQEALDGADAAVLTAAHDEYRSLDPETVSGLLRTDLVFDAVDVLDERRWDTHDVRLCGI